MEDFIPTRVSKVKKEAVKGFVSIHYERPKKQKKDEITDKQEEKKVQNSKFNMISNNREEKDMNKNVKPEGDIKRIAHEVMKFGMAGFEKVKAEEAKIALAISLGAKPPKKKGINYKVLKEQRKHTEKKVECASGLKNSLMKHRTKKPYKKGSNDILKVYGKVSKNFGISKK